MRDSAFRISALSVLLCLVGTSLAQGDDKVLYTSEFSVEHVGWAGRAGSGSGRPRILGNNVQEINGEEQVAITTTTKGTRGSGLEFSSSVAGEKGRYYLLLFFVKIDAPTEFTFHVNGSTDSRSTWKKISAPDHEWTRVEYLFEANGENIGLEIGANQEHEPCKISVANVSIRAE